MTENLSNWVMTGTRYTLPTDFVLQVTSQARCDPETWGVSKEIVLPGDFSVDFELFDWTQATGFTLALGYMVYIYLSDGGYIYTAPRLTTGVRYVQFGVSGSSVLILGSTMKRYCRISRIGSETHFDRWDSADRTGAPDRTTLSVSTGNVKKIVLGRGYGATSTCNYYATYKVGNVVIPQLGGGGAIMF